MHPPDDDERNGSRNFDPEGGEDTNDVVDSGPGERPSVGGFDAFDEPVVPLLDVDAIPMDGDEGGPPPFTGHVTTLPAPSRDGIAVLEKRTEWDMAIETSYTHVERAIQELQDEALRRAGVDLDGLKRPHRGPSEAALVGMKEGITKLRDLERLGAGTVARTWRQQVIQQHQDRVEKLAFARGGIRAVEQSILQLESVPDSVTFETALESIIADAHALHRAALELKRRFGDQVMGPEDENTLAWVNAWAYGAATLLTSVKRGDVKGFPDAVRIAASFFKRYPPLLRPAPPS